MRPSKKSKAGKSLSDRRGASSSSTGGIAFDFGDGTSSSSSSYSQTSGILSSVGRLGIAVAFGALVLVTVLLRRDASDATAAPAPTATSMSAGVAAAENNAALTAGGGGGGDDRDQKITKTSVRGGATTAATTATTTDYITLKTPHGNIRITLRPDLSPESVDYVRRLVASRSCDANSCRLYRAEKPGILQGILKSGDGDSAQPVPTNKVLGACPDEYRDAKQDCPPHDPNCGCHGPVMTKGHVGWAAGTAGGPDFFINTYEQPAAHWGNQHTVWGFVEDDDGDGSLATIQKYWELPVRNNGGMHLLVDEVPFTPVASGGRMARLLDSIWSVLN